MARKLIRIEHDFKNRFTWTFRVKARLDNRKDAQRGDIPFLKIIERDVEAVTGTSTLNNCAFTVTIEEVWAEDWPEIEEQILGTIFVYLGWSRKEVVIERHATKDDGKVSIKQIEPEPESEEPAEPDMAAENKSELDRIYAWAEAAGVEIHKP